MRARWFYSMCLGFGIWSQAVALPAMTPAQNQTVEGHLKEARAAETTDAVKAFLHLREALRLEQLWSGNTLGDDSRASHAMERFTTHLMRHDDDRLLRILHSRAVPLPEKLSLLKVLEEEIILNYPGVNTGSLLQGYDE